MMFRPRSSRIPMMRSFASRPARSAERTCMDLHMVRGTMAGMEPGTILGHEGAGIVSEVGPAVWNLSIGDRVVIPSTIGCGTKGCGLTSRKESR